MIRYAKNKMIKGVVTRSTYKVERHFSTPMQVVSIVIATLLEKFKIRDFGFGLPEATYKVVIKTDPTVFDARIVASGSFTYENITYTWELFPL